VKIQLQIRINFAQVGHPCIYRLVHTQSALELILLQPQQAMSSSKLTVEFRSEFEKLLKAKGVPPNEHLQQLKACLSAHKISYWLDNVHCKYFLTHKTNRGGLMLSAFNCHRNAAKIKSAGGDMQLLRNAMCTELAPAGTERESQIIANRNLIRRANGYLADINSYERYLTMGCGHTAAFCKTAEAGGRTPEKSLQMEGSDLIDSAKLKRNDQFRQMLEVGWGWLVIPWEVDRDYPQFAKIAQAALNTSNHSSTEIGELETAVTMADSAHDKQMALAAVQDLGVPCGHYADKIFDFLTLYGGGDGSPLIHFMDAFAKMFKCNINLGESFWSLVTAMKFQSNTDKYALARVALCMANLVSPKIEDGIGKLIVKNDLTKLTSKNLVSTVEQAEQVLKDGMSIVELTCGQLCSDIAIRPLGQLFVRVALISTDKCEKGPEGTKFTFAEVKQLFLESMSEVVGKPITFDQWAAKAPAAPKPQIKAADAETKQLASLNDLNDPEWIAKQAGYEIGGTVIKRGVQSTISNVYAIFSINDKVQLQQVCSYGQPLQRIELDLGEFLHKWHASTMTVPVRMDGDQQRPKSFETDLHKTTIYKAILEADKSATASGLVFWRKPDELRSGPKPIPAGKILLAPVAGLMSISTKQVPRAVKVHEHNGTSYYIIEPPKPAFDASKSTFPHDAIIAAFWWVGNTDDNKQANMSWTTVTKNGISVPMLTNSVEIQPFTKLSKYRKTEPVPDKSSMVVITAAEPAASSVPEPPASKPAPKAVSKRTVPKAAPEGRGPTKKRKN
jgi:hypothetical protein